MRIEIIKNTVILKLMKIKKTQTYLVELENTLREKQVKVQSQQMEL